MRTANYEIPRTVFGGALIKNGYGSHPEEIYVCPRGFNGKYTIRVKTSGPTRASRHPADARGDHARRDREREEGDPQPISGQAQQARDRHVIRGQAQVSSSFRRSYGGDLGRGAATHQCKSSNDSKKAVALKPGPVPAKPKRFSPKPSRSIESHDQQLAPGRRQISWFKFRASDQQGVSNPLFENKQLAAEFRTRTANIDFSPRGDWFPVETAIVFGVLRYLDGLVGRDVAEDLGRFARRPVDFQ